MHTVSYFLVILFLIAIAIIVHLTLSKGTTEQQLGNMLNKLVNKGNPRIFRSEFAKIEAHLWIWSAMTLLVKSNEGRRLQKGTALPLFTDMKEIAVDTLADTFPLLNNPNVILTERMECYRSGMRAYAENLTMLCLLADSLHTNKNLVNEGLPNIFQYPVIGVTDTLHLQPLVIEWIKTVYRDLDQELFFTLINQTIHTSRQKNNV